MKVDGSKCLPLTLEQAKALTIGQVIYSRTRNNADGSLCRAKVTGQVRTWKRSPQRVQVPWKHGLYVYGHVTENNLDKWSTEPEPFARFKDVRVCPATGDEHMLVEYIKVFLLENKELGNDTDIAQLAVDLVKESIATSPGGSRENEYFGMSYELFEVLPTLLNKYAPDGYYFGTHEADGEWGFWQAIEEI